MNTLTKIGVHHFGGTQANPRASTKNLSLSQIEFSHRAQWPDFISCLGYATGYNEIIFPSGDFIQTRMIGEETAAVIGSNKIGYYPCLAGNFTAGVDNPTDAQKETFRKHAKACLTNDIKEIEKVGLKVLPGTILKFSLAEVKPHRLLHPNHTDCYGLSLPDDWARRLVVEEKVQVMLPNGYPVEESYTSVFNRFLLYYLALQDKLPKKQTLGAVGERACGGFINL